MPADEVAASLPPEILEKAKALVEAAGPDYDWGPLMRAVDKMMEGAANLPDIDFDELFRVSDESVQLLKVHPREVSDNERYPSAPP